MYFIFIKTIFVFLLVCELSSADNIVRKISKHRIVYPKVLTRAETIRRFKRSNIERKEIHPGSLYIALDHWIFKTFSNSDVLLSPNFVTQWGNSNSPPTSYEKKYSKLGDCLALQGHVDGVKESKVILTLCGNDIFGLVTINEKSYFLQPLKQGRHALYETKMPTDLRIPNLTGNFTDGIINFRKNDEEFEDHNGVNEENIILKRSKRQLKLKKTENDVKYAEVNRAYRVSDGCRLNRRGKRALTICDTKEQYNMTRDLAGLDYLDMIDSKLSTQTYGYDVKRPPFYGYSSYNPEPGDQRNWQEAEEEYDRRPRQNVKPMTRWVKINVGVDCDIIEFHGERTQQYVFTIFNIVSEQFKKISNNITLKVVIMRMLLYPDCKESAIYSGEPRFLLFSVNKWNRALWKKTKEKHDMAVWMTNYKISEDVSTVPGAFMCQFQWSCLLIEDVGWLSAIKISHGIGHLIGLTHDGDLTFNNNCASESLLQTTIMTEVIPAVMPIPTWSSCSIEEFETAVLKYFCLERPPMNFDHSSLLPGTFSLDAQCRIEFGDGWMYCSRIAVPDPCKELWCNKAAGSRRSCMTRQTPTLEGTRCGRGKKCMNHTCEDAKRPEVQAISVELSDQLPSTSPSPPPPVQSPFRPEHPDFPVVPQSPPPNSSPNGQIYPGMPSQQIKPIYPPISQHPPQHPPQQPSQHPSQQHPQHPSQQPQHPPQQPPQHPPQHPSQQPQHPPQQPQHPPQQPQPPQHPSQQPPHNSLQHPSQQPQHPPQHVPQHPPQNPLQFQTQHGSPHVAQPSPQSASQQSVVVTPLLGGPSSVYKAPSPSPPPSLLPTSLQDYE